MEELLFPGQGHPIKLLDGIPEFVSFPLCGTGQREGGRQIQRTL